MYVLCLFCPKKLKLKYLEEHLRSHTKEKPFWCTQCQFESSTKCNLKKHVDKEHLKVTHQCKRCKRRFNDQTQLINHAQNFKIRNPHQCELCCQSFKREHNLTRHEIDTHGKEAGCDRKGHKMMIRSKNAKSSSKSTYTERFEKNQNDKQKNYIETEASQVPETQEEGSEHFGGISAVTGDSSGSNKRPRLNNFVPTPGTTHTTSSAAAGQNLVHGLFQSTQAGDGDDVSEQDDGEGESSIPGEEEVLEEALEEGDNVLNSESATDAEGNNMQLATKPNPCTAAEKITNVLMDWGFNSSSEFVSGLLTQINTENRETCIETVISFLRGNRVISNVADISNLLVHLPESYVGYFVVSIIICELACSLNTGDLISLFEEAKGIDVIYKEVVTKITVAHMQNEILKEYPNSSMICSIPPEIENVVSFDLGKMGEVIKQQWIELSSKLDDLIFYDLSSKSANFLQSTTNDVVIARLWGNLKNRFLLGLSQEKNHTVHEHLMLANVQLKRRTVEFLNIMNNNEPTPICLHKSLVEMFSKKCERNGVFVEATPSDVQVFIELLYCKSRSKSITSKVTVGVYNLAKDIGIGDIFGFLFGTTNIDWRNHDNLIEFLQVMVLLRKNEYVVEIAKGYRGLFNFEEKYTILNGLDAEDVLYFLEKSGNEIVEIDKYRLLLTWAFWTCKVRVSDDVMKMKLNDKVAKQFEKVSGSLDVSLLGEHSIQIIKQNFISSNKFSAMRFKMFLDTSPRN